MRTRIEIWLTRGERPELLRVRVSTGSSAASHESVRGQFAFGLAASTFSWTSAVHALALLLVRSAFSQENSGVANGLSGERGSPATTLDYALAKQSSWIRDICGPGSRGLPLLREILLISNSHSKRPGPVEVRLKPTVDVVVFVEDVHVGGNALGSLAERLRISWQPYGTKRRSTSASEAQQPERATPSFEKVYGDLLRSELKLSLESVNIANRSACSSQLKQLMNDRSFRRVAGSGEMTLAEDACSLAPSARCGVVPDDHIRRLLNRVDPLRVAIGVCNAGPLSLFSYLQYRRSLPFQVDASFAHALEIGNRIVQHDSVLDHDLVAVASAPAATLFANRRKHEYVPLMFLPPNSQEVVRKKRKKTEASSRVVGGLVSLLHENPSTVLFYFERLRERSFFRHGRFRFVQHEPWESFDALQSDDPELLSVLFFPFGRLNVVYNQCEQLQGPEFAGGKSEVILFVKRNHLSNRSLIQGICAAVRSAWLALLEDPQERELAVSVVSENPIYMRSLRRFAGIRDASPSAMMWS
ncbi:MAG: hypothetical protein U0136_13040 [Bdellovibrionota bacterium]